MLRLNKKDTYFFSFFHQAAMFYFMCLVQSTLAVAAGAASRVVVEVPVWPDSPLYAHAIISGSTV